jgi:NAD(P)-dependent dehydrogenase (short-subunit alcohol dehydrogenase family)
MNLQNKVAIVTGAGGGGCGRVIARRLAREGCRVVVSDIDDAGARETARQIVADSGQAVTVHCDIAREGELQGLFAAAQQEFGGVDVMINNAGPHFGGGPLDHWLQTMDATLVGSMRGTLLAIEALRQRGGGAIVNFGSTSALGHGYKHSPWPGYDIAKAGVMRLTTTLGWLGEKENIRVNCLVPAWIASEEVAAYVASVPAGERAARGVPKTLITLDQVADAVIRLVNDESLAGRLLVLRNDERPGFVVPNDHGYAALDWAD